ncbi:limit dextrinase isoform X1 [Carex rostrata]
MSISSISPLLLPNPRHNLPFTSSLLSFSQPLPLSSLNSSCFRSVSRLPAKIRKPITPFCSPDPKNCMMESEGADLVLSQEWVSHARAYWVEKFLIAWDINDDQASLYLYSSINANLSLTGQGIEGYDFKIALESDACGLPVTVTQKFPHISSYQAFRVPSSTNVEGLLKCQLAVASYNVDGTLKTCTGLQLPGVLDDMFAYLGSLGATFTKETISLNLWAPTAQEVTVCFYEGPTGDPKEHVKMEEINGVWSTVGPRDWEGRYYTYEITVFHPSTSRVEKCQANDPYARGLSSDGKRTWLVDIRSEELKPNGWDGLANEKPHLGSFADISIYELHIRDFSASDSTVDPDFRGRYPAFTCKDSAGIKHLRKLSEAGLTHVHLLPSYQFGGVDDNSSNWSHPDYTVLSALPPDSDEQQAQITAIQDKDGYNWGYNPVLWGVPKGSYATNPDGSSRILEFRQMIQALNRIGLRVVLDVVYNHLYASGPFDDCSVLDKIVPGYYLRRNKDGDIENSSCVNNTASEHLMVERLILDDLLCWAVDYKVDGFRFDLMGHIMKHTMVKAKDMLQSLTEDKDGVDGSKIYLYGEGWDFGEVAKNQRGINASQFNISGTGIGSFNDRIRDAVLGGSPFGNTLQQGFVTGLSLEPNGYDQGGKSNTDIMLSGSADYIQVGLAGNLRNFVLICHGGETMKGSEIMTYGGDPIGYAMEPTETINYVSAHDNETLFDIISLKTPFELSIEDRCRMNHVASSIVALSQGIPFFHAGDELLRSKSLDRDSYNSGDWFNRLDFTYETNNWGVGLPPKEKNEHNWPLIKPRLANPSFKPNKSHILAALRNFTDLLKIRYSSPLFRLSSANSIQERVRLHNTGPSWVPGVIVMSIEDEHGGKPGISQLDPMYSLIVVVFNASPEVVSMEIPDLKSKTLQLHPVQLNSADDLVKKAKYEAKSGYFSIPQRTTTVFVQLREF